MIVAFKFQFPNIFGYCVYKKKKKAQARVSTVIPSEMKRPSQDRNQGKLGQYRK